MIASGQSLQIDACRPVSRATPSYTLMDWALYSSKALVSPLSVVVSKIRAVTAKTGCERTLTEKHEWEITNPGQGHDTHTHTGECIFELGVTRHEGGLACGQARAHTAATAGCFHTEVRVDVGGRPAVLEITLVVTRLCRRHQHTVSVRKYAIGVLGLGRAACNVRLRLRAQRKHNCGEQCTPAVAYRAKTLIEQASAIQKTIRLMNLC